MTTLPAKTLLVLLLLAVACGQPHPVRTPPPPEMSGFLDDYTDLRPGGAGELGLVYRDPKANWKAYDKVLLEPVTLWRSGRKALDPIPEADLVRLIVDFHTAVRRRLGEGFTLVEHPGPGVMRIRLGITDARASDQVLDILTLKPGERAPSSADTPLDAETRRFVAAAAIEGEIRDAQTGALLAAGVDRRRQGAPPLETWGDLDRALAFWADRVCDRLEARTGRP